VKQAVAALVAVCALLAFGTAASADVRRATLGDVSAKLVLTPRGGLVGKLVLTVTRAGAVVYSASVTTAEGRPGTARTPRVRTFLDARLRVIDLDGDGTGEAIVDLAEQGAYCCSHTVVVGAGADGRYAPLELDWGSYASAEKIVPIKDGYLLVARDARLDERYTPHALSFEPVRVWRFDHGTVQDVSRAQPLAVQGDLGELLQERARILRRRDHLSIDLRGLMTAITGDRLLLGRRAEAIRALHADVVAGRFRASSGTGPTGAAFPPALLALLGRLGYPE
jgi:hypothetical protein